MVKITTVALLLGALAVGAGLAGCSNGDQTDMLVADELGDGTTGSLRLALQAGDRTITTVSAVIEGKNGFETQTHEINVQGNNGVISIFFGDLPVGKKYRVTLSAADCSGSANFNVTANQISLVNVPLTCGGSAPDSTGGVQVTGTIAPGTGSGGDCDHVLKIVAAPSIQNGDGPVSQIELFLNEDASPTTVQWTTSSTNGGAGTIGDLSGTTDQRVSFDCSANGTVFVAANVTAPVHHNACTEQARVSIECVNQGGGSIPNSVCGNGVIENGISFGGVDEVCDTNGANPDVLPTGTPAGSTCNAACTAIVPPTTGGAVCGNGTIETGEVCDTNGANPDVLPAGTTTGSTCNATCTAIVPPTTGGAVCGNGSIETGEVCDTNGANPDVLPPTAPAGSTCNSTCSALVPPTGGGLLACLTCARTKCPTQYNDAVGTSSDAANLADVTQLFDCVIGPNWEAGGAIPSTSCFFADASQPGGSLVPCYCGPTPVATCLATGPANNTQACGRQVEVASRCSPITASCVTGSGSNPAVPLGDALQLLNCERAACQSECGFPRPAEE